MSSLTQEIAFKTEALPEIMQYEVLDFISRVGWVARFLATQHQPQITPTSRFCWVGLSPAQPTVLILSLV